MDLFSDKFISYQDTFDVKLEKSSDYEKPLNSNSSLHTCESPLDLYPNGFSSKFNNMLNPGAPSAFHGQIERRSASKKHKPFRIIKAKKDEPPVHVEVKIESEEKISNKSKLIMKREKARQRAKIKLDQAPVTKIEAEPAHEEIEKSEINDDSNKKVLQMIRNRISAQNSRDKKKLYVYQLEETKQKLYNDMLRLRQEKDYILEEVDKLREMNAELQEKNQELRNNQQISSNDLEDDQSENNDNDSDDIQKQTIDEIMQKVINLSDPLTSNFVSQNKNLFGSTFSFAMNLSALLQTQINQKKALGTDNQGQTTQKDFALPRERPVDSLIEADRLLEEEESLDNRDNGSYLDNQDAFVDFCMNENKAHNNARLGFRSSGEMYNNSDDECIPKSPFIKFEEQEKDDNHDFFGEDSTHIDKGCSFMDKNKSNKMI